MSVSCALLFGRRALHAMSGAGGNVPDATDFHVDALEEDLLMNTGEIEVVGDASEPMATRPATQRVEGGDA